MFGGPLNFLCLNMFSVGPGIFVFKGARVLRDGKILRVPGGCSLYEVLQEVGFGDQVDDVLKNRKVIKLRPPAGVFHCMLPQSGNFRCGLMIILL